MIAWISDRLPLVIGVTGHPDLRPEDTGALREAVAGVIGQLKRDYLTSASGTIDTPIIVLSALAEGAHRLVAEVAIAEGASLIAPLPMAADEYRNEFAKNPGSVAQFDSLLAKAIAAPTMPFANGNSLEMIRNDQAKRDEQYREVGIFIARHCHVLLALWDSDDQDKVGHHNAVGGPAEIVQFRRRGIPLDVTCSPLASLDSPEIGPIVRIVTPRTEPGSPAHQVAMHPWGHDLLAQARTPRQEGTGGDAAIPDDEQREVEAWENFAALIALTVRYNREAAELARAADGADRKEAKLDELFKYPKIDKDPKSETVDQHARREANRLAPRWCAVYGVSDTLAQAWQQAFWRDWRKLFELAFIAFIAFEIFAHLTHLAEELAPLAEKFAPRLKHVLSEPGTNFIDGFFLAVYILAFAMVFRQLRIAHAEQHQERFVDYRALAEALRIAIFWKLAGVVRAGSWLGIREAAAKSAAPGEVLSIADVYPIKQPSELAWVKTCLRTLELLDACEPTGYATRTLGGDGYSWVRNLWVAGQFYYFSSKGPRHNETAERRERCATALLVLSIAIVFFLVLFKFGVGVNAHEWRHAAWRHDFAIFVIALLPALAAALLGFSEKLAYKAQSRQYDRMHTLFKRALDLLPSGFNQPNAALFQRLFGELGLQAMRENAEWVAIYRQRPIQAPQG